MKKIYEIKRNFAEIAKKSEIRRGCTLEQMDQSPDVLEEFEKKEEALEALKKYTCKAERMEGYSHSYYIVEEVYIEENVYDDGEWIDGGDVLAFAEEAWTPSVKSARIKAGLTQQEFSKEFEIPLDVVKSWDSGRRKPPAWAEKLLLEKLQSMATDR